MNSFEKLDTICKSWNIRLIRICKEIPISGSPERSEFRVVVESTNKRKFILEKLPQSSLSKKKKIFLLLENINCNKIIKYLRTNENEMFVSFNNEKWQISNFIEGQPLERPDYIFDEWRGRKLAEIYINFKKQVRNVSTLPMYLSTFCLDLKEKLKTIDPELFASLNTIFAYLESDFFPFEQKSKISFCHGDLHQLNIIWGEKEINSIIDWEFCGSKIETYDLANQLGCLGFEQPLALNSEYALSFFDHLQHIFEKKSIEYLFETILAIRLAWLSDWLLRKDQEMIDLELKYIRLLFENRTDLKNLWKT